MENKDYTAGNKRDDRSLIRVLIGIIIVLVIVSSFLAWKLYTVQSQIQVIITEKQENNEQRDKFKSELDSLILEHKKIKEQYGGLNKKLSEKDSLIQSQIAEITQLLNSKVELSRVKKKMDALRRITQSYVKQIDSLFTVNRALKDENVKIKTDFQSAQEQNQQLAQQKNELVEKVNSAAVLKAYKITGKAIRLRKKGTVEEDAEKAKKAEQIKVSFILVENALVDAGPKNIYVRISGPDGRILTDGLDDDVHSFMCGDKRLQFSIKQVVNYDKKSTDVSVYWKQKGALKPGAYTVDVFTDVQSIGSGGFSLQ